MFVKKKVLVMSDCENNVKFDEIFNFSLIDIINSKNKHDPGSNVIEADTEVDNDGTNSNLNLQKINQNLSDAIDVYHTELLKISSINEHMDNLNRKYSKMKNYLNEFKSNIQEFKEFFKKNLSNDNSDEQESKNNITMNINSIYTQIDTCQTNIDKHMCQLLNKQNEDYKDASNKIKSLDNIFTLIRMNKKICPICMQHESTHFTVPCGHLYCKTCSEKITISCFICRQNILKVNSLYFS